VNEGHAGGLHSRTFVAWVVGIVGLAALQSMVHLVVVLRENDLHSLFDLDRSNGAPDLVSTLALACGAVAASTIARREPRPARAIPGCLAATLATLTLADLLHDGAHLSSTGGVLVIGMVAVAAALMAAVGAGSSGRMRATSAAAAIAIATSFLVSGLDRLDGWFERRRGDPVAEYQIVAKEGLELVGWSLVALALWDEAIRRRAPTSR